MSHSLDRFVGKVAIVTGASSGIGAAIAEALVKSGVIVAGFARRSERVESNAKKLEERKGKLHAVKVDVTKEEDIKKGFKWVADNLGPIHILINNAGIAKFSSLTDGSTKDWLDVVNTNVVGLSICTREAVKNMKENNVDGHIIHINSIVGHKVPGVPNLNIYPATKHAVTALTETLRQELSFQKLNIKITSISPGFVRSEIQQQSGIPVGMRKMLFEMAKSTAILEAEDIADSVLYVLSTPKHVQIHELTIKPIGETV